MNIFRTILDKNDDCFQASTAFTTPQLQERRLRRASTPVGRADEMKKGANGDDGAKCPVDVD